MTTCGGFDRKKWSRYKKNKKQNDGKETQEKNGEWKFEVFIWGGASFFFEKSADEIDLFWFLFQKTDHFFFVVLGSAKTVCIGPESVYMI